MREMMERLGARFSRGSIRYVMFASFTISALVAVLLTGMTLYARFSRQMDEAIQEENQILVSQVNQSLSTYLRDMIRLSDALYYNVVKNTDLEREEVGEEIARLFAQEKIDRILTIETSGIPLAMAASVALSVPMVFAKKNRTSNLSGGLYQTVVHSYTHNTDYTVVVEKQYLPAGERVLLVDDFLANGRALMGLMELVNQAGSQTVGAVAAIEKGFQKGGDLLRSQGLRVEALALIDSMDNGNLVFRR